MHRYTLSYFVDSIVVLLLFACLLYSYEYDKCGRVIRITHDYDKVEEQTYSYYSSGRLQGGKIEQSGEWHFEYDKDGQLTEKYKGSSKVVGHYPSQTRYERKDTGGGVQ